MVDGELAEGEACLSLTFFTSAGRWAAPAGKTPWGNPSNTVSGSKDWTRCEIVLTAPKTAASAVPKLRLIKGRGTCWFDDLEFRVLQNAARRGE